MSLIRLVFGILVLIHPLDHLRVLILFEDEDGYNRDSEKFYNSKIIKVSVTVEGHPNQFFRSGGPIINGKR